MNICSEATRRYLRQGPVTLSSDRLHWLSLLAREAEYRGVDKFALPPVPDTRIAFAREPILRAEYRTGSTWLPISFPRGTGILQTPGTPYFCRWNRREQEHVRVRALYLPQDMITSVASAMQRTGTQRRDSLSDLPFMDDPVLMSTSEDIISAVHAGAPDFYAQIAGQWIAAHLLVGREAQEKWNERLDRERITDRRLLRVFEYIEAHLSDRLTIDTLAQEAGMSKFHFARLFSKAANSTPHRHILTLRLKTAAKLLTETDRHLLDIAITCGFRSASQFSAVFLRELKQSPSRFRRRDAKENVLSVP